MSTLQETSATQEAQALSEKEPTVNRKYKDTVFRMLFSEKKHLLSLYNAVTGKHYEDAEALQIVTLKNAIYMGMKNDLAFLLETNIYLYEHQSTVNPNMPLRNLLYIAIEYQKYVSDKSLYSSSLLKIPAPKFVVFYNGTDTLEDTVELKLSSAYEHLDGEPDLELKVILLNINEGHNKELMEHCQILKEYAIYVARVRKYAAEMKLEDAVNKAIEECINEYYPGAQVNIEHAEGLAECKKMLTLAKVGKLNGCMIEGMACPGGCMGGAGTNAPYAKAAKALKSYLASSTEKLPSKELEEIELN